MQVRTRRTVCHMDDLGEGWLTIDELAREVGVTVRQVRSHQARGLLPPPEVRARTGYYGPEHRARLELVVELQAEGVKLDTVRRLLDTTGDSTSEVLAFARGVRGQFAAERAIATVEELAERFGGDRKALERARRLGLVREVTGDQYEEVSPRLSAAGAQLVALGVPLDRLLHEASSLRRHADGLARSFVETYLEEVWAPFEAAGRPDDQWPRMHEAVGEVRAAWVEALQAAFELAVSERLDVAFGRDLSRHVRVAASD